MSWGAAGQAAELAPQDREGLSCEEGSPPSPPATAAGGHIKPLGADTASPALSWPRPALLDAVKHRPGQRAHPHGGGQSAAEVASGIAAELVLAKRLRTPRHCALCLYLCVQVAHLQRELDETVKSLERTQEQVWFKDSDRWMRMRTCARAAARVCLSLRGRAAVSAWACGGCRLACACVCAQAVGS